MDCKICGHEIERQELSTERLDVKSYTHKRKLPSFLARLIKVDRRAECRTCVCGCQKPEPKESKKR